MDVEGPSSVSPLCTGDDSAGDSSPVPELVVDSSGDDVASPEEPVIAGGDTSHSLAPGDDVTSPEAPKPKKKKKGKRRKYPKERCGLCISPKHNLLTHNPKDPNCPICNLGKPQKASCVRSKTHGAPDALPEPKKFGDALTADHAILNEEDESRNADRAALVVKDRHSNWTQGYAAKTKDTHDSKDGFQRFLGPQQGAEYVYTDGSKELD